MTIKKAYVSIIELLEANTDALVGDILTQVRDLAAAKTGGGTGSVFARNEEGEVIAIRCYYHKLWFDPRVVDFGKKVTSPTGLNTLSKDGMSKWTKQQREAKQAESVLLSKVFEGELLPADIPAEQEAIKEATRVIVPREDGYGFETLEECIADSDARGLNTAVATAE